MFRCIGKNVIVELSDKNDYEKNGIIIKTNSSNLIGLVICVGNDVNEIRPNDKVIYNEQNAKKIIYDSKEYFVLDEKDILALI